MQCHRNLQPMRSDMPCLKLPAGGVLYYGSFRPPMSMHQSALPRQAQHVQIASMFSTVWQHMAPTARRHWLHSEMWWPRLLVGQPAVAWDDYEKDYSDLPREACLYLWTYCCTTLRPCATSWRAVAGTQGTYIYAAWGGLRSCSPLPAFCLIGVGLYFTHTTLTM